MALVSHIPPSEWLEAGGRAIATAEELLNEAYGKDQPQSGPRMSG